MAKTVLQGISLAALSDGYAGRLIDKAIEEIVRDLEDRGHDGKARKLVLEVEFKAAGEGLVSIKPSVKVKAPTYVPPPTMAKLDTRAGGLTFNPDFSENPDQQTFADIDPQTGEIG